MNLENIQVEQISKDHFRIITDKGQYLQNNNKIVSFIDKFGKRNIIRYYYTLSNNTINALCKFFSLSKTELLKEYRNGSLNIF